MARGSGHAKRAAAPDAPNRVHPRKSHSRAVYAASFSPDGRRIVTVSSSLPWEGTARVWDAESGKPVGEPMHHQGRVTAASFSPDGRRIVTGSIDQTVRVWDTESGKPV